MSTNESLSNNAAASVKRKMDHQGSVSNKRRSLRGRNTITTPDAGKLSPMEVIGSLTFDIAKTMEGWTAKESRNRITKTYTSNCGKTFDSFKSIGEFVIASKDWIEELADDEGAIDALKKLARDGDERAISALGGLDISVEEEKEDADDVHQASMTNRNGEVVIGLSKADYRITDGEITKFKDKVGEFLTGSAEMFFANFIAIVTQAESKLDTKNAPVLEEIKKLEEKLGDILLGDDKQKLKVESDLAEKKNDVDKRKKLHEKRVKALVKELAGQFLASGFALPEHLEVKYGDLLSKHPVLKKIAFPTVKTSTKKV